MAESLHLTGSDLTIADLAGAARGGVPISLDPAGLERMSASHQLVEDAIDKGQPVYGVTTGLGARVTQALDRESLADFSRNTIRGRAHSVGPPEPRANVRAAMIVRLNTALGGHSGASPAVAEHLLACLNVGLTPVVPRIGSVGMADLVWNATLALALIGEGEMEGGARLEDHGLTPPALGPRDGLALASNSSGVIGAAALALYDIETAFEAAQTAAALSLAAFGASLAPFDPAVLALKPLPGQDRAADGIRARLDGSDITARRLQDPLSFRNIPQVHGTAAAGLDFASEIIGIELNTPSDNPVVLAETGRITTSGAYATPHLALALETVARAMGQLSMAALARISKHLDPDFSGLPLFLAPDEAGSNAFAPVTKTAEALVAALLKEAQPAPIWTSLNANGTEDVMTSAPIAARALAEIAGHSRRLTAIELMIAARASELRDATLSDFLASVVANIRTLSPMPAKDRPMGAEIEALADAIINIAI